MSLSRAGIVAFPTGSGGTLADVMADGAVSVGERRRGPRQPRVQRGCTRNDRTSWQTGDTGQLAAARVEGRPPSLATAVVRSGDSVARAGAALSRQRQLNQLALVYARPF